MPKPTQADGIPVFCAFDELVPTEKVTGNPRNPNTHPEKQIEMLARIIDAQGWRAPITVSKRSGFVVRGHGRLAAARLLGKDTVPVDIQDYADEAAEWADMIADNRIAELAEIDAPTLKDLLQDLDDGSFEMELTGFDVRDLERMMTAVGGADVTEDEPPEPPADPVTTPGDLWLLGEHRVLCGDSTKAEDVARLMDGKTAAMLLTDPPYGLDRNLSRAPGRAWRLKNDDGNADRMYAALHIFDDLPERYVWGQWNTWGNLTDALGIPDNCIVWVKNNMGMGHGYRHQHEFCAYYGAKSFTNQSDVWESPRDYSGLHPTMKPVGLCARAIENSSAAGALVADPFLGSGTTLIAAEQLGRVCYGMELDPAYCDVIVTRWESLTGKKAVLAETA